MVKLFTHLKKKHATAFFLVAFISVFFISAFPLFVTNSSDASSNTIYVDDSGGANYTSIQNAIDHAADGDIIYVYEGIYHENVVVNKKITLQGENKKAVIDAGYNGDAIIVTDNDVYISGFTTINGGNGSYGIKLYGVENCTVKNCNLSGNYAGMGIFWSNNNIIDRNVFSSNTYAIFSTSGKNNRIEENIFLGNTNGIRFGGGSYTSYNIIRYNNFMGNSVDVIDEGYSNYWDYDHIGNYWDRYAGVDGDGDGIGDTPYVISGDIKDHYPLIEPYAGIDIFPPDIVGLQASPQIQIPGGSINITCQIIDNVGVNATFLSVAMPNGSYINISLNRVGNTTYYYFNLTYDEKGVYNYYVWANDTSNNSVKSGLHKFVIAYKPHATFSYTPPNPTDLDTVAFNGSSSYDPDGYITNYTWNLGDGSYAYTAVASHKYSANGDYSVYTATLTVYDNDGAWDTMSKEITVANVPPVANFTFTPHNTTVGQTVWFNDSSHDADGRVRIWQWNFGDGISEGGGSGNDSVTHTYAKNGVFNITLIVTDDDGGTGNITKQITVRDIYPPELKDLTAYPNPQEIQGNVNITCNISDDVAVATAMVNVTGPAGSFNESMKHTAGSDIWYYNVPYNVSGNYTCSVWAEDPSGNANASASYDFKIIIPAEPPKIADIQSTPVEQQYGSPVNISCYATDNVAVAEVGVNITRNGTVVGNFTMHPYSIDEKGNGFYYYNDTYLSLGNYTYFVWDMDINGYTNTSETKNFSIVDTTPPEIKNISVIPSVQEPNGSINISCSITDNMAVNTVYIVVECPNDTTFNNSMLGGFYFNRTYTGLGTYNWTIHANDTLGNSNVFSGQFSITFFPKANFSYSPAFPTDLDTVHFTDLSDDSDGFITNYTWNFGDGNVSYEQNPEHMYSDDGQYNITLTVTDNEGAIDTIIKEISVSNVPPAAGFVYTPQNPTDEDIVSFNASSSSDADGHIANYTWDFGDGSTGYGAVMFHRYPSNGNYTIRLTVRDDDGSTNFTRGNITILNCPPVANFSYFINGFTIYLTSHSSDADGHIANCTWNFGDGNISYEINDMHRYAHEGVYNVSLVVTDDDNASSEVHKLVSIGVVLVADFSYYPENPVSDEQIDFMDNSSYASAWQWNFGDGSTAGARNPVHTYPIGNYYNVTLTVFNGSKNASISKILKVGTQIQIFKNEKNVVNYIPWLGNNTKASELAAMIGSDVMPTGSVVSRWNVSSGTFDSYVVGISPPSYDFVINPYDAVVLRVAQSGSFVEQAFQLADRVVHLFKNEKNVVNNVAWSSLNDTKASELAAMIGSDVMPTGSVVSRWNVSSGTFDSYVVGISPPSYDFVINPGDCIVLRVANSGDFQIEVIK